MKYLSTTIIISFLFSSYYDIGDTVITSHQNESFDICYGDYPYEQFQLSHFNGKITIFGLSTSWWPTTCTFSLEALIDSLGNDNRIELNEGYAQAGNLDSGAPTSTGFTIPAADVAGVNRGASKKYIYYAHA